MRKVFFILALLSVCFLATAADTPIIKNSLMEIDTKLDKVNLKPIRTWGAEDDEADEHLCFKNPTDVAHDSQNNIYFVDNGENCIKVFDTHGKFLRQIGERGQGPGTFFFPLAIGIDHKDQIWLMDQGNRRFQVLSTDGKSLAVFKTNVFAPSNLMFTVDGQMVYFDDNSSRKGKGIIATVDMKGKETARIGFGMLPPRVDCPWAGGKFDSYRVAYEKRTKTYYIATMYTQMIQTFQGDGKLSSIFFYDTPINQQLDLVWDKEKKNFNLVKKAAKYSECVDIAVDDNGLIFTVVTTRLPRKSEKISIVMGRSSTGVSTRYIAPGSKNFSDNTNLYRLLVFSTDGKVVAAKQLDTYCDGIYIHKNRLFIIDTAFHKVVYEYEYSFK